MAQARRERRDEVGIDGERDQSGERRATAAGHTQALARELAGGVGDERERVGHVRSLPALHARGLDLAQKHFELIDGAPEAQRDGLRGVPIGP